MILLYVLENFITDDTPITYLTEDPLYVVENLYNERPSLPYRTVTKLTPEWLCIDLGEDYEDLNVNFVGLFNHNLTIAPGLLRLCGGNAAACAACNCDTDLKIAPADDCGDGCGTQPIANFRNTWSKIDNGGFDYRYWKLEITDTPEEDYYEIGELVLGEWQQFPRGVLTGDDSWVRLSPGRADGSEFFMGKQRTHYGQDWSTYYSECERFDLTFTTQNDPCRVDDVHTFLKNVQKTGGRFVLIPDDTKPFCYYVIVENLRDYAERKIYGPTRELREWRLKLKTLTEGLVLL